MTGTINRVTERGFGFIAVSGRAADVFFHARDLPRELEFDSLTTGQQLEFDIITDPVTRRDRAANIRAAR